MSNGKQGNLPGDPSFAFGNSAFPSARGDSAGRTSRDAAHRMHAPGVADRLAQIPEAPVQTFVPEPTARATTLKGANMDQPSAKVSDIPRSSPDYLSAGTPIERSVRDGPTGVRHEEIQSASAEAVVSDVEIDEFERKHRLIDFIWSLVTFRWLRALLHGSRELNELREQVKKFEDYRVEFEGRLDSQGQMIADQRMRMDERVRAIVQSMVPDLTPTFTRLNALESELRAKLEQLSKQPESVPVPLITTPNSEEFKALQARVTELDAHVARLTQEIRKEANDKVDALRKTLDDTFANLYKTDLSLWLNAHLGPMVAEEIKARRSLAPLDGDVADDIYNQLEMMGDDLAKLEDRLDSNEPHMLSVMRLGRDIERRLQFSDTVNSPFASGRTMIETPLPANMSTPIAEVLTASIAEAPPVANPDLEHAFMASEPTSGEQPVLTQEQLDAEFASKPSVEPTAPAGVSAYNGRSEADTGMSDEEFAASIGIKRSWSTAVKVTFAVTAATLMFVLLFQVARSNWFQSLAESARQSSADGGKAAADPRTKQLQLEAPASVDPSAVSVDSGIDYPLTGKHNLNSSDRLQKAQQQSQPAADPSTAKPPKPKSILGEPKKKGIERKLDSFKKESRADEEVVKDYSKFSSTEEALKQFQRDLQNEMNGKKAEEPPRELPTIVITPKWHQLERPKEPKVSAQTLTLSVSPTPCPFVLHEGEPNEECVR